MIVGPFFLASFALLGCGAGVSHDSADRSDTQGGGSDTSLDCDVPMRWYADVDGDGYGDPGSVRTACEAPDAYFVTNADDCDDAHDAAFPGGREYCDELDNDCDGVTDEEEALDQRLVYVDADGDGAGDPKRTSMECGVPDGFAAGPDDCDDSNASMSPNLAEICNDGLDNDCDGTASPCGFAGEESLLFAEAIVLGEEADHVGYGIASGDLDGDGHGDVAVRGRSRGPYESGPAAVHVLRGPWAGMLEAPDVAFAHVDAYVGEFWEASVNDPLGILDLDGDGYDDLVSPSSQGPSIGVFVFASPLSGTYDAVAADYAITTDGAIGAVSGTLETIGDLDGDGSEDIAVGEWGTGRVYFVLGPIDGDVETNTLPAWIEGPRGVATGRGDAFGAGIGRTGDLDGDGARDVVVGAPDWSDPEVLTDSKEGLAWVYAGPFETGITGDAAPASRIRGGRWRRIFGAMIDIVPDLDGDGYDDLVFGNGDLTSFVKELSPDPGEAGIFYGPLAEELSATAPDFLVRGEVDDATGTSVAVADADGDGALDLLVGDPAHDGAAARSGAVFGFRGPFGTGTVDALEADWRCGGVGEDNAGTVVENLGDLNGDGVDDIGIGGPMHATSATDQGAVFVVFGGGL